MRNFRMEFRFWNSELRIAVTFKIIIGIKPTKRLPLEGKLSPKVTDEVERIIRNAECGILEWNAEFRIHNEELWLLCYEGVFVFPF